MIFSLFRYCYLRFGFNSLFSVELEVNFIAIEAGTWTGAPVCGLRPVRALRLDVLNEPKPGHATFSPFLAEATTSSKMVRRLHGRASVRSAHQAVKLVRRNPQTGAPVQVPASIAMKFTSSSTLKSELNPNRK